MIKNKMALLGAVATLGMVGGGFVSPAQAVVYNVSGRLADNGFVSGSFNYSSNTYTDWSINVLSASSAGLSGAYNTNTSFVSTSGTADTISSASQLILALNGSNFGTGNFQLVRLVFNSALTGTPADTTSLVQGSFPALASPIGSITSASGDIGNGQFNAREAINSTPSSVTAVPWETDALSVIGATTLFGFGVWTKRKRKVDLSK
jgi:hypothetical protein